MLELIQAIGLGLVMLLPLANPLTTVALFLGLAGDLSTSERNMQALQASIYVFIIMMIAFYGGQLIMDIFGISIPGLRIAGGLIVSFIGFRMLFPQPPVESAPEASSEVDEIKYSSRPRAGNIAFVPLAIPSTAGPGTIAMIISSASQIKSGVETTPWVLTVAPVLTTFLISLILWLCLRSSGFLMRLMGKAVLKQSLA